MPTTVKIAPHNGRTAIAVDDRVISGMSYTGFVHVFGKMNRSHFQEQVDAGVRVFFCPWLINADHFSNPSLVSDAWSAPDALDFSLLDGLLDMLASMSGGLWFIPRLYLNTPPWWAARHPEELVRFADSEAQAAPVTSGFRYDIQASMASERWRKDVSGVVRKLVTHVENGPHAQRVLGYMLNSGGSSEWVYWGSQQGRVPDYSPPALVAFRHWLTDKYGNDAGLSRAWHDPRVSLDGAAIPSEAVRRRCSPRLVRDPRLDQAAIDYELFLSDLCADTLLHFCHTVKEVTGRRRLTGAFYGYLLWQTGLTNAAVSNAHLAVRKLLDSPDIDFLTGITSYSNRGLNRPGSFMLPTESIQAAGKLHYSEVDVRTHLITPTWPQLNTAAESVAVYRREFAHQLAHGSAWWNFDMTGGWYSFPEMREEFARQSRIADEALAWDMASVAEVAAIVSGKSPAYQRFYRMQDVKDKEWGDLDCDVATENLYRSGFPFDWWMTDDLGRKELRRYKVLYVHNAVYLSRTDRDAIDALKSDGRTIVFVGWPGLVTDDACAVEHAESLTGMRLRLSETRQPGLLDLDYDHELARGCENGCPLGTPAVISPCLEVNDLEARTLATWHRTGRPAAAVKEFKRWRSIFFPMPPNNADLFRSIARTAGCHIWTDARCVIFANRSLLAVHGHPTNDATRICLPEAMTVTDLFSGEVVAQHADCFVIPHTMGNTTPLYRLDRTAPVGRGLGQRF